MPGGPTIAGMAGRPWWIVVVVVVVVGLVAGCASSAMPSSPRSGNAGPTADRATLAVEAIPPASSPPAATRPTAGRPPVDAVVAYAVGLDAVARHRPADAVAALRRAAELDPLSPTVQRALGRTLWSVDPTDPAALAALRTAVALAPDDLDAQTELGRSLWQSRQFDAAVARLRRAMLTPDYRADPTRAAVVDLLLARSLAAAGYDRAAMDRFVSVISRFNDRTLRDVVDHPELAALAEHPADLLQPIGELFDRHAQWAAAVRAYQLAAEQDPARFDLQRSLAMDRARLGRGGDADIADAARRQAVGLVVRERASPASLVLLTDVCRELGQPDRATDLLRQLSDERPTDRPVLLALVDRLTAAGRSDEAARRLRAALDRSPGDRDLSRRLRAATGRP